MAAKSNAAIAPWLVEGNSSNRRRPEKDNASERKPALSLVWQGIEYPRVNPGNYLATCVGWQGPEYVRRFHRWSLRLEFCLLDDGTLVSGFLNFGKGSHPVIQGPNSKFFKAWCMANGEQPKKGQKMAFETFVDPELIYTVQVGDCDANSDRNSPMPGEWKRANSIRKGRGLNSPPQASQ